MPSNKKKTNSRKKGKENVEKKRLKKEEKMKELREEKERILLVAEANKVDDVLAGMSPFATYKKEGIAVTLTSCKRAKLSDENAEWAFKLLKCNMEKIYEEGGWGWKDAQKRKELLHEDARFLIATDDKTGKPVAFAHFRFVLEGKAEVLYIYELQIHEEYRSKGLGKHMTQVLEIAALRQKMKWVMLTVFKSNAKSMRFFMKKMKYEVDETSPSQCSLYDESTYEILSKSLVKGKASKGAYEL